MEKRRALFVGWTRVQLRIHTMKYVCVFRPTRFSFPFFASVRSSLPAFVFLLLLASNCISFVLTLLCKSAKRWITISMQTQQQSRTDSTTPKQAKPTLNYSWRRHDGFALIFPWFGNGNTCKTMALFFSGWKGGGGAPFWLSAFKKIFPGFSVGFDVTIFGVCHRQMDHIF